MSLLSADDRAILKQQFATMTRRVRLLFFTQAIGCEPCLPTRQILDALVELSDRLDVEERNPLLDHDDAQRYGIEWAPSIVPLWLDDEGQPHDSRLRIVGMPTGFEFVALIKAITVAGGSPLTLSPDSQRAAADVQEPLTLTVFSTPSCPHCPGAAALAFELAAAGPQITATSIEATSFPDVVRRFHITGVPKTISSAGADILGVHPEGLFVEQVLAGATLSADGTVTG